MSAKSNEIPKTPLAFTWDTSRPYALLVWLCNGFVILASGLDALEPFVYKYIVDSLISVHTVGTYRGVWLWVGAYIALYVLSFIFWHFVAVFGGRWYSEVRALARVRLTEYLLRHSHEYFENRFAGSTANKIAHAAEGARNLIETWYFSIFPFLITVVVSVVATFYASPIIGWIFILWLVVVIPLNYVLSGRRIAYTVRVQAAETLLRGVSVDIVSNVRAVQEYVQEGAEMKKLLPMIIDRKVAGFKNMMAGRYIILINGAVQIIFMGGIVSTAVLLASRGSITVGTVVLVLALSASVGMKIFSLGWQMSSVAEHWGEIKEGLDDVLIEHDIPEIKEDLATTALGGSIHFNDVTFGYGDEAVLTHFSLVLKAGERVGFVGRSGAGKSTIAKLLLRHYDINSGSIDIGGIAISSVSQNSLRKSIAIIPQESNLFHRSIRENIAYGKTDATLEEVQSAAKLAQAHDFVESLPSAYDTLVGERGVKLSGGQRQRVAIARAILKNAPILILDEATSALDSESEVAIQKALHELMEGKTVIAIAHRLSTLREMDRIIVLDEGNIAEEGTHDELVKNGGVYARLWAHQAGGFLQE